MNCINLGPTYRPPNVITENIQTEAPSSGKTRNPDFMDEGPDLSVVASVNKPLHTDNDVIFGEGFCCFVFLFLPSFLHMISFH